MAYKCPKCKGYVQQVEILKCVECGAEYTLKLVLTEVEQPKNE